MTKRNKCDCQGFAFGSGFAGSVLIWVAGLVTRRAKTPTKIVKNIDIFCFEVLDVHFRRPHQLLYCSDGEMSTERGSASQIPALLSSLWLQVCLSQVQCLIIVSNSTKVWFLFMLLCTKEKWAKPRYKIHEYCSHRTLSPSSHRSSSRVDYLSTPWSRKLDAPLPPASLG